VPIFAFMRAHTKVAALGGLLAMGMLAGLFQDVPPRAGVTRTDGTAACTRRNCPPTTPTNLVAQTLGQTELSLSWSASTSGGSTVVAYRVWRDGTSLGRTQATSYVVRSLTCGKTYTLEVAALDARGKLSDRARTTGSTSACPAPPPTSPPPPPPPTSVVWVPAPRTTWQWQITGIVDTSVAAQMYDVDLFDARPGEENGGIVGRLHTRGIVVICYLDTGAWESYRPDAGEFPASVIGNSTGWSGERWLDIRRAAWPQFAPIIWRRLDLAKSLGCDGVEPDQNNPVGNDPGFPITLADQKAWYLEVARQAHARGLSVGMKNGIETVDAETAAAFDWALNEECFQYDECDLMRPFLTAGKAVFQVEYKLTTSSFCTEANQLGFNSMRKRLALDAWRETCW
jgi:hypothetical protein